LNIDFSGAVYEAQADRVATYWQVIGGKKRVMLDAVSASSSGAANVRVIRALAAVAEQVTGEAWSIASAPPKHRSIFEIVISTARYGG
jgi:hypothetical protein